MRRILLAGSRHPHLFSAVCCRHSCKHVILCPGLAYNNNFHFIASHRSGCCWTALPVPWLMKDNSPISMDYLRRLRGPSGSRSKLSGESSAVERSGFEISETRSCVFSPERCTNLCRRAVKQARSNLCEPRAAHWPLHLHDPVF